MSSIFNLSIKEQLDLDQDIIRPYQEVEFLEIGGEIRTLEKKCIVDDTKFVRLSNQKYYLE